MSVKRVGNVWSFRVSAGIDERTGKRKQVYRSGFRTKREVQDEMNLVLAQVSSGEFHEPEKVLFKDFVYKWLHDTYRQEVQLSSFEVAETNIRVHLVPYFQEIPLTKITAYEIDCFYAQKSKDGLANATIRKIHNVLSKSFQKAVKWGLIKNNPVKDATPPTVYKKPKQTWTVEEAKIFLDFCERENEAIPFLLAIFTGMRRGDCSSLEER